MKSVDEERMGKTRDERTNGIVGVESCRVDSSSTTAVGVDAGSTRTSSHDGSDHVASSKRVHRGWRNRKKKEKKRSQRSNRDAFSKEGEFELTILDSSLLFRLGRSLSGEEKSRSTIQGNESFGVDCRTPKKRRSQREFRISFFDHDSELTLAHLQNCDSNTDDDEAWKEKRRARGQFVKTSDGARGAKGKAHRGTS